MKRLRFYSSAALLCALSSLANTVAAQPAAEQPAQKPPADPAVPATSTEPVAAQPEATTAAPPAADMEVKLSEIMGKPGGLTAAEAARRAAATSLDAEVEEQRVEAAEAQVTQVFYRAAPRLTLTARYTRLSPIDTPNFGGSGDGNLVGTTEPTGPIPAGTQLFSVESTPIEFAIPENNYYLNAGLVVPISDYLLSTGGAVAAAQASKRAAILNAKAARVRAGANAKLAYYGWAQNELETVVALQSLEQAKAQLARIESNFAAGRVAEADVLSARAFLASAELLVQRSRTNARLSEQQLAIMMHSEKKDFELGEDLLAEVRLAEEQKSLEELYEEAARQRLEIRALDETAYSLERGADVQSSDAWPRLEAFGNATYANPNQRIFPQEEEWRATWDVGAQLVWTLNDIGTAKATAKQTRAERLSVIAQRSALRDALKTEVLSAYRSLNDARVGLASAQRGVEAAEAAYASRLLLLQYGRVTSLEVMDAETALLRARLDLVNSHVQLRVARVQLDHALGRDAL